MLGILIVTLIPVANADGLSLRLVERANLADEDTFQVESWESIQVSLQIKKTSYVYASTERASVAPQGYHGFDYVMYSVGTGTRFPITKKITAFGQIGLMKVVNSWGGRKPRQSEAFEYYLNRKWYGLSNEWLQFDAYSVKNSDAITAEIGFDMAITDSIFCTMSYRMLKITEKIAGYRTEWDALGPNQYWTSSQNRNYSSVNIGFGVAF